MAVCPKQTVKTFLVNAKWLTYPLDGAIIVRNINILKCNGMCDCFRVERKCLLTDTLGMLKKSLIKMSRVNSGSKISRAGL